MMAGAMAIVTPMVEYPASWYGGQQTHKEVDHLVNMVQFQQVNIQRLPKEYTPPDDAM
jgi:hypothetical protein